jgi:hypothetical protein
MPPIGSSSRRLLNLSTQSRVANSAILPVIDCIAAHRLACSSV